MSTTVQEGIVRITTVDDTAAGLSSATARVAKASKTIGSSATSAAKPLASMGATAKASADTAGISFDQLSSASQKLAAGMGKVPPVVSTLGSTLGALAPAAAAAVGVISAGAAIFDSWAGANHEAKKASANLQITIDGARDAFGGLVTDMELARLGNKAFALGVVQDGEEFAALAAGVHAIAANLGEDDTQLFDNAITAIGRGSALILDNLGIILDQAKAEKIYAQQLGVTVSQLTAYQKSQAFSKAALHEVASAAEVAGVAIDGLSTSYLQAKVRLDNLKDGLLGFNDNLAHAREGIRKLSEEELARLSWAEFTDTTSSVGKEVDKFLREAGTSLEEIDRLGQATGQTFDQIIGAETARRAKLFKDEILAGNVEMRKNFGLGADALEHQAKLLGTQKGKENEILGIQYKALDLRLKGARAVGDTAEQLAIQREMELLLAEDAERKRKAGGSGPTAADRVKAEGQAAVEFLQSEVAYAEVIAKIRGTEKADALEIGKMRLEAADAALELERDALLVTRAKNSVERLNNDNRITAIDRERELLALQRQADERAAANDLVGKALAQQKVLDAAKQESWRTEREHESNIIDLDKARLARQEQRTAAAGALAAAQARSDLARLGIVDATETRQHQTRMAQLEAEHRARVQALDTRAGAVADYKATDDPAEQARRLGEVKQIEHDREVERQNYALNLAKSRDAEEQRLYEASRSRLLAQVDVVQQSVGALSQLYENASSVASAVAEFQAGRQDDALSRTIGALERRGAAERANTERALKASEGDAAKQNAIKRNAAKRERELQAKVEKAQADHEERKKRTAARGAGIKLIIDGVVNAAQAVSAFASFNYLQGALYVAAAATNFIQGGLLLSGTIPGPGAAASASGAASGSAGAGSGKGAGFDTETSSAAKVPGSTPGEAARRSTSPAQQAQGAGAGGTVVNIYGGVHANGAIDDEFAEKVGFAVKRAGGSREGL